MRGGLLGRAGAAIGVSVAPPEAEVRWHDSRNDLFKRSLTRIKLGFAADRSDLSAAQRAALPSEPRQRCRFHSQ